jgi:hypothetical protein
MRTPPPGQTDAVESQMIFVIHESVILPIGVVPDRVMSLQALELAGVKVLAEQALAYGLFGP